MNDSQIREKIEHLSNPVTGDSLKDENRILSFDVEGETIKLSYDRTDIPPAQKKELESQMLELLAQEFSEDNIFILPTSVKQPIETAKQTEPAKLKVGHGTIGEKKSIPNVKHIIAIGSGKGGVGKSTFTSNLAISLKNKGHKVGIIDGDIYGPSIPMIFKKRNLRPQSNEFQKIIPLENYDVKFMSFGSFIHEDEPVVWRGPMLGGVLNQFFFDTEWGELDYLLIDLPPGTGDVQLSMTQNLNVDGAIIISTPQDMALLDARKALHMFDKMDVHVIGMVENMSSFICGDCGKEHFIYGAGGVGAACSELGVGFLGKIPMEMGVRKGSDFGKPYMENQELFKGSSVWNAHEEIAAKVDSYFNPTDNKKKGILSNLFGRDKH